MEDVLADRDERRAACAEALGDEFARGPREQGVPEEERPREEEDEPDRAPIRGRVVERRACERREHQTKIATMSRPHKTTPTATRPASASRCPP